MNISQALAKITGASALIIYRGGDGREVKTEKKRKEKKRKEKKRLAIVRTSSSVFMTFLILAKGRSKDLNSEAFTA